MRSVSRPPAIEPPTEAAATTKKKTPMPASVCSKAGSIERISDGTSRPVHPTSSIPAQARAAAIAVRVRRGSGHVQMLAASCRDCPDARPGRYRRAMARPTTTARGGAARKPATRAATPTVPRRPCRAASCSSSTARTRPRRAWSRPWHGSRTRSVPAAGTSRSSRRSGAAGPACDSGTGRRRSTAAAVPRRCRSRSCAAGSARTRS